MVHILRNKNLTTRFQILAEIAGNGPVIQQRAISRELKITPQAVSDYISQLIRDGMLVFEGRSKYRLTSEAVNWVISALRELDSYNTSVQRAINNISVCAAIAEVDLEAGQRVDLKMQDGLLVAFVGEGRGATGITISGASQGFDVGVTSISGIIPLAIGRVTIIKVPGIEKGGSATVDCRLISDYLGKGGPVASLGLEAWVALKRSGVNFQYFGAAEAVIEASKSGLNPVIVCVEGETSRLINRLVESRISYQIIDAEVA